MTDEFYPSFMRLGQTNVDVAAYNHDLSLAIAKNGPGKRYLLNRPQYVVPTNTDVVLGSGTILEGTGPGNNVIVLQGTGRVVTDQFDALTGTSPASGGVGQFAIRHLTVEGGNGVKIYGYAYEIENVTVRATSGIGFYSEWTDADNPIPAEQSMEARVRGLKTHHCGSHGFVWNGPHDSALDKVVSFFNAPGSTGIYFDAKGAGTHLTNGHAYGVDHTYAIRMLASGLTLIGTQAEGASVGQVEITKAGSTFLGGRVYSAGANPNVKGIVLGRNGDVAASTIIDTIIEECRSGALDVTYDGGGGMYRATLLGPAGATPYVGTMPATSQARFTLRGGMTLNGWADPWVVGNSHHTGTIDTLADLVAASGTWRVEPAGVGSTMALTNLAAASVPNPGAGAWKLYLTTGTTGGTAKLVAKGASGTVTTILDNIPA